MILSIPYSKINNFDRKRRRKFVVSSLGEELDKEFEIILFGDRSKLVHWVYNHYFQLMENENKYKNPYDISYIVSIRFISLLILETEKWYPIAQNREVYNIYIPYYYDTVIVPILRRFHKQKAFL